MDNERNGETNERKSDAQAESHKRRGRHKVSQHYGVSHKSLGKLAILLSCREMAYNHRTRNSSGNQGILLTHI